MKEACAVARDTVTAEKTCACECRLTEREIGVDKTSRGLLLTERQVRAPLCDEWNKAFKILAFKSICSVYSKKEFTFLGENCPEKLSWGC